MSARPWEPSYGFCGEAATDRVELAHSLEAVRRRVCAYMGDTCDCKYGLTTEARASSEHTGCPELRELIHRLLHRPESLAGDVSDSYSIGDRVEWNPTGDTWEPGTVTRYNLPAGHVYVRLDENDEQLLVDARHLRRAGGAS
jgi:hypothetical protein